MSEDLGVFTAGLTALGENPQRDQQSLAPNQGSTEEQTHEGTPLTEEEIAELRKVDDYHERASEWNRRDYVYQCLKGREMYAGNPRPVWDAGEGMFRAPFGDTYGASVARDGEFEEPLLNVNFYQGNMMTYAQLMLASHPSENFFPERADRPEDVEAARVANDVVSYLNTLRDRLDEMFQKVFISWVDGTYGTCTRYVVNGQRFGWTTEPIMESFETTIGGDTHICPNCGANVPATDNTLGVCPECNAPLGPDTLTPTEVVTGQRQVGTRKMPLDQVVSEVVSGLELRLPHNARDKWQFPYVKRTMETDKSLVRATYPKIRHKIKDFLNTQFTGSNIADYERLARLRANNLATGRRMTGDWSDLVTLRRTWFRPWAFEAIENDTVRESLKQKFPEGVFLVWAEDVLCEARPENIDDVWAVCHFMPGDGQQRIAVGSAMVQMQEAITTLVNMQMDVAEFTLPLIFGDTRVIDPVAVNSTRVRGGVVYPAVGRTDCSVREALSATQAGEWPAHADNLRNNLAGEWAQFILGLSPASYGGNLGGNDTAQGIQMERDQALGRVGLHWQRLKQHLCEQMRLEVDAFAKGQQDPIKATLKDANGATRNVVLDPKVLLAGNYRIKAEVDDDFPTTWAQRRNLLTFMLQQPPTQPIVQSLANADEVTRTLGTQMKIPGRDAYDKQLAEIPLILAGQAPPIDPVLDDLQTKLLAIKDWWASSAQKEVAPPQLQMLQQYAQQLQMLLQPPAPPPGAEGAPPPGGAPPGPPSDQPGPVQ